MLTDKHQVLSRPEPHGQGGTQFLYRVYNYGIAALSIPHEDISQIHWRVDVIKYQDSDTLNYAICHDTDLADKTLTFRNDKSLNQFLEKAFGYFRELEELEKML